MLLSRVKVKNYRSLLDIDIPCSHLTAFVGANGMGKSSILQAINLFYSPNPQLTFEDWFNRDTKPEIEITLTFTELGEESKKRFAAYIQGEDLSSPENSRWPKREGSRTPTMARHSDTPPSTRFGMPQRHKLKSEYNKLREQDPYKTDLPAYSNQDNAKAALREWEGKHPGDCKLAPDDGQFFGFKQVGQGYLGDFSCLIFVPACARSLG